MNKFTRLLEGIGLSKNGAHIYLTLLEYGKSSISELSEKSGLQRVQLYRLLPYLIETALVLVCKEGKKKYYLPASPMKINEIYQEIQESQSGSIQQMMEKYIALEKKPSVLYQKGKKGITHLFQDIIESSHKGDIFYRVTSEIDTQKINEEYLPKDYRQKRDKKELERYVIMSGRAAKQKLPKLERELKVIPENIDDFEDNVLMTLYANKIGFIDFNTETSIIIESKEIADFQKKLFKLLYKSLPK